MSVAWGKNGGIGAAQTLCGRRGGRRGGRSGRERRGKARRFCLPGPVSRTHPRSSAEALFPQSGKPKMRGFCARRFLSLKLVFFPSASPSPTRPSPALAEAGSAHRISHRSPGRRRVKTCTNHHGNLSPFPRERAGTDPPAQGSAPAFDDYYLIIIIIIVCIFFPPSKALSRCIIPSLPLENSPSMGLESTPPPAEVEGKS